MVRPGIEIIAPKDRAAWLRVRGKDITASAVGALFDCHEFISPLELWASKTGRLQRDDRENEAMRRGRLLEPVAVQILRETQPEWRVEHNAAENLYYRDPLRRLGATPDVIAFCPRRGKGIVQIKSVEAGVYRRKWVDASDDGTPQPPLWIALQALLEAYLTGADWAAVAPLVIGHGIEMPVIDVPLDNMDGVIAAMAERAEDFWRMVAEDREPVINYDRDAGVIDRIYAVGDAGEEIDLTDDPDISDVIAAVHRARDQMRAAEAAAVRYEAEVKAAMGTAEIAHVPGGRRITWRTHRRTGADGKPTVYRVLRLPPA